MLSELVVDVADVDAPLDLGVDEGYALEVPSDGSPASLRAQTVWGALHGLQTLSQLVRFDFDAGAYWVDSTPISISDSPEFAWRGVMVDPARQFLPLATLRAVVDSLAIAKLNTLHVHILDCDSFPIEVRAPFSNLWAGAFSPRERYTAADLAGLVDFARLRGVRIVFEFDQPGHMGAMCKGECACVAVESERACGDASERACGDASERACGEASERARAQSGAALTSHSRLLHAGYRELCPTPACDAAYGSDVLDPSSAATLPAMQAVVDALVAASADSVLHLGGDEVGDACWLASPAVRAWMAANNATTGDDIYR